MSVLPPNDTYFASIDMDRIVSDVRYRRRVIDRLRRDPRLAERQRQDSLFYELAPAEEE